MQHLVADLGAHYARLLNQPNLRETWAFHKRLVLPPSQRGRSKVTREFTVIYPNPDMEVEGPGCGGEPANEDLGPWQSHMVWEYGTDGVAGFLAGERRYVEGPRPANVGLWPIAHLRHHESDESGGEEGGSGRTTGAARTQGVTAPSGSVMAPCSIAPSVVSTAVPTIPEGTTATTATIPTPTVGPHNGGNSIFCGDDDPAHSRGSQHHNNHRGTVDPGTAPHLRRAPSKAGGNGGSRYAADTAARGWGGTKRPSRDSGGRRVAGGRAVGASPGRGPTAVGDGPATLS
jgi:hypothetical protein